MTELEQIHKLFEEREKRILEEASQLAREIARKELALLEFEMFCEVMVPKESKEKAENSIQKLRNEKWQEALTKANGNEEDAISFYAA